MPLKPGDVSGNIRLLRHEGFPSKQAVAIALSEQRRNDKMAKRAKKHPKRKAAKKRSKRGHGRVTQKVLKARAARRKRFAALIHRYAGKV